MRVSQIKEILSAYSDDDEMIIMFWEKPEMVDSDYTLSTEGWSNIVREFEEMDGADQYICDWLADSIIEHGEEVE